MATGHQFVSGAIDLSSLKSTPVAAHDDHGIATSVIITRDNVEEELIKRSAYVPVIALIGTARSAESEQLRTDFITLAQQAQRQFIFAYIDADTAPEIAGMFSIQALPTVVAIAAGQPIANFSGGQPRDALAQWCQAVVQAVAGQLPGLPDSAPEEKPEDERFAPATEALNRGDYAAALRVYEDILAQDPKNIPAKQAKAQASMVLRIRSGASAQECIRAALDNPLNVDAQLAAADHMVMQGETEAAFELLIKAIFADKQRVRERLLELFELFDATDPRIIAARQKMASALF